MHTRYSSIQKLSESRATDMDRLKKLAGIPSSKQESQDNKELEKLKKELFQYAKDDPMVASVLTAKNKDEFDRRLKALYSIRAGSDVIDLIRRMQELAQGKISNKRSESRSTSVTEDVNSRLKKFFDEAKRVLGRKLPAGKKLTFKVEKGEHRPKEVIITPGKLLLDGDKLVYEYQSEYVYDPDEKWRNGSNAGDDGFKKAALAALEGLSKQLDFKMAAGFQHSRYRHALQITLLPQFSKATSILDEAEMERRIRDALQMADKGKFYFYYSHGEIVGGNNWDEPYEYDEQEGELTVETSLGELTTNDDGKSYELTVDVDYDGLVSYSLDVDSEYEQEALDEFYKDLTASLEVTLPGIDVKLTDSDYDAKNGTGWVGFVLTVQK